jgi:hypothetical protein
MVRRIKCERKRTKIIVDFNAQDTLLTAIL